MRNDLLHKMAIVLLGVFVLAGCAEERSAYPYPQLSPVPPPEAPLETPPALSNPSGEIWRPGHWGYNGLEFYWISGDILSRPAPTAVWSADRWEFREYGWAFVPGYWQ
jgi:hypothetical protein